MGIVLRRVIVLVVWGVGGIDGGGMRGVDGYLLFGGLVGSSLGLYDGGQQDGLAQRRDVLFETEQSVVSGYLDNLV